MASEIRKWIPFPIFVLSDDDGERAIIPNDTMLKRSKERVLRAQADLDEKRSRKVPRPEIDGALATIAFLEKQFDDTSVIVAKYRNECEVRDYRIAKPTFGQYIKAEEDAKDWIDMQPQLNRSKFMLTLLSGNVQLDGNVLSEKEVSDMEPDEAPALFEEIERLCFPDPSRIPFWNSRSAN